MRRFFSYLVLLALALTLKAADPMATLYSENECLGSFRPYVAPQEAAAVPDSLTPIFINHVGRHGSRFIASANGCVKIAQTLAKAQEAGVLTPLGQRLLEVNDYVMAISHNRWGALDSVGLAEQRGIASRMFRTYPKLFDGGKVNAISSYSPRCMMSMYEFTHQLDRLNNHVEVFTASGRQNSKLMRPFDVDVEYLDWVKEGSWEEPYKMFFATTCPVAPVRRLLTDDNFLSTDEALDLAFEEYKMLAGLPAMGVAVDLSEFFTLPELNALWACANLRQYLLRSASTLSTDPAYVASDLLLNLIETADEAVAGTARYGVQLRFCHAETVMPLLSLLRLQGCYYMTNYFDTVGLHWRNFNISPMSANLQMVLFKNKRGRVYVRFELNEQPIALEPNSDRVIIPWEQARKYMVRCLPLHMQPD